MESLLKTQGRIIGALILRETRATFGSTKFGYLWAILVPATGISILMIIFTAVGRQPPFGSSLPLFFATGILTLEFFNKLANSLASAFSANKSLLIYPLIKEVDTLLARWILISATYLIIMFLFYSFLVALKLADYPSRPEELVKVFITISLLGFGFGTLNAVITSLWPSWQHIEKILMRPLFFISGIFYIPSNLPPAAIDILKWNPVLHLVEWVRYGYYPNYDSLVLSRTYPLFVAILMILFGLACERLYRKKRI